MEKNVLEFKLLTQDEVAILREFPPMSIDKYENLNGLIIYDFGDLCNVDDKSKENILRFIHENRCVVIKDGYYLLIDRWSYGLLRYLNSYFDRDQVCYKY